MTFEIDWSKVDPIYNWVAIDRDGDAYAYIDEPEFLPVFKEWVYKDEGYNHHVPLNQTFEFGGEDHIYKRPEKVEAIGHKHAKLMLEYAQDALVSAEPWQFWEFLYNNSKWYPLVGHPEWDPALTYRRKPELTTIEIPVQHKEAIEAYIKSLEQK
jgi:hypothetical protein